MQYFLYRGRVLNQITIDSEIAPYASSERDLLMKHIDKTKSGDLLLLDRGYPCIWLLFLLKARGVEFCVRMKDNWWLTVKDFTESEEKERIVTFRLPKKDRKKLAEKFHQLTLRKPNGFFLDTNFELC